VKVKEEGAWMSGDIGEGGVEAGLNNSVTDVDIWNLYNIDRGSVYLHVRLDDLLGA
jgi:hypothetical protein